MTSSLRTASMPRPRIAVAALLCALLAVAAAMAVTPGIASAASPGNGRCEATEFCLGWGLNLADGTYDNTYASDGKLYDNWFLPNLGYGSVDQNTWSAVNKKSGDVAIFDLPYYETTRDMHPACISAGRGINLPPVWQERIRSWKVVTRSVCHTYWVLAW